jgi:hypothetical protein
MADTKSTTKAAEKAESAPRRAVRALTEADSGDTGPGTNKYVRFDGHRDYPTSTNIQAEIDGNIFKQGVWHEVSDDLNDAVTVTEDQGFLFTHRTGEATKRMVQESHEAAAPVTEAGMPGFNPQGHAPVGEGPGSGRAPVAGAGAGVGGATAGDGSTGSGAGVNASSPSVGAATTSGAGTAGTGSSGT